MTKFFEIFGKISLVAIVLTTLVYGGYYLGSKTKGQSNQQKITTESTSKIITEEAVPSPTAMSVQMTTISAGLSKSAGLSFNQYSITIPEGWTSKKESQTQLDEKLILENNGYTISIFQAATGGALCLYAGDADFEGPSSRFDDYFEIKTKDGRSLRRSGGKIVSNIDPVSFTICQKSVDGSYQQPTNYGHISIKLPANWDQQKLDEIDSVISSLKKI